MRGHKLINKVPTTHPDFQMFRTNDEVPHDFCLHIFTMKITDFISADSTYKIKLNNQQALSTFKNIIKFGFTEQARQDTIVMSYEITKTK